MWASMKFLPKVAHIKLSLANLQLFMRIPAFSIFLSFSNQETVNVLFFSLLRNLITHLNLKFLPKLRKNYKNITFRGRPAATAL